MSANGNTIRLIVSDLDGTLLSPDHSLPDRVLASVQHYVREGGLFTIATGRPLVTARRIVEQLGIRLPVILCNGAVIAADGAVIERHGLAAQDVAGMLLDAHESGLNVLQFRGETVQAFRKTPELEAFEEKEHVCCRIVSAFEADWRSGLLEKAILLGDIEVSRQVWTRWQPLLDTTAAVFQSESNYLEVIPGHVSKGTALLRLGQLLGVRPEEIVAIGNQLNDLPMLERAGIGAAVANSPQELMDMADYICSSSYGEGVIEVLQQFVYGGIRS